MSALPKSGFIAIAVTPLTDDGAIDFAGMPGIELRLPILYSAGVASGQLSMSDFVRLIATNPAKVCGLYPRKGSLEIGADADLVIWDEAPWMVSYDELHDNVGYTPYEGVELVGRAAVVVSRGEVVVDGVADLMTAGRGRFIPRR